MEGVLQMDTGGIDMLERDRYPQVVWPEEYFYPDLSEARRSFGFELNPEYIQEV